MKAAGSEPMGISKKYRNDHSQKLKKQFSDKKLMVNFSEALSNVVINLFL